MRQRRKQSGFTLLELVLVMVIIAIALSAAVPMLQGWSRVRDLNNAADQFVQFTRLARAQAAADGVIYRLNIDANSGTYQLTKQDDQKFITMATDLGDVQRMPVGFRIELTPAAGQTSSSSAIDFYPTGRTQPSTIRISAPSGDSRVVNCPAAAEQFVIVTGVITTGGLQ